MIWHAASPTSYASGPYLLHYGVQCWTCWLKGVKKLGESEFMSQAMKIAERHALQASQG